MPKTIAYIRVSTAEQADSGLGLEAQLAAIRKVAEPDQIFKDEGLSGSKPDRPGLLAALDALESNDILIVAKRDRLSRDTFLTLWLEKEIKKRGARLVSASGEGTENDDPSSVLMRRIVDAFAEYERLIIAKRTSAALQAKRARGEYTGGRLPKGRKLAKDGRTLVADEKEQKAIHLAKNLRTQGHTLRQIAQTLRERGFTKKMLWPESIKRLLNAHQLT